MLGAGVLTKKDGAIFGPHKTLSNTSERKTSPQKKDSKEPFRYPPSVRPGIPKAEDKPVMGIVSNKNFVTANAVEAILMGNNFDSYVFSLTQFAVPKSTVNQQLNYLEKEDYGKIPEYLGHVKEEVRRENDMIDKYVKEQMGYTEKEAARYEEMSNDEREDLIVALKTKWDAVNAKYQKITHLVRLDTIGQLKRKEQMEAELRQLEVDIDKLTRNGPVLIA